MLHTQPTQQIMQASPHLFTPLTSVVDASIDLFSIMQEIHNLKQTQGSIKEYEQYAEEHSEDDETKERILDQICHDFF